LIVEKYTVVQAGEIAASMQFRHDVAPLATMIVLTPLNFGCLQSLNDQIHCQSVRIFILSRFLRGGRIDDFAAPI